jgi:hypothetical protein
MALAVDDARIAGVLLAPVFVSPTAAAYPSSKG